MNLLNDIVKAVSILLGLMVVSAVVMTAVVIYRIQSEDEE